MSSVSVNTLQDLAALCHVSKMTASRALRGQPGVSPALAAKIRAVAERSGYKVNPTVGAVMRLIRQSPATDYRENIAFVWTHPGSQPIPLLTPWRDHARARAEKLGYRLDDFFLRAPGMTSNRLREILRARGIRGILFAPDIDPPLPRVTFQVDGFAAALLGSSLLNRGLARVQFDHFQLIHLALRHVRKAGYRRPALIMTPSFDGRSQGRVRAGYLAHSPAPVEERSSLVYIGPFNDRDKIAAWLKERRVDAILYIENDLRKLLMQAPALRFPQDYALVALSKQSQSADISGTLQSAAAIGHAAVDMVVAQMQRHEFGKQQFPQKVMLEGTWSPGATLPWRRDPVRRAKSRRASARQLVSV